MTAKPKHGGARSQSRTFSVEMQTLDVEKFDLRGNQHAKAEAARVERVFKMRCIRGNIANLPLYIVRAVVAAGYLPIYLGGTTYKYSVIGLRPISTISNIEESRRG